MDGSVTCEGLWLRDDMKDPRVGRSFAIRCVEPDEVHGVVSRLPGARGRTDSTVDPGGASIWSLSLERHADVVGKIGGIVVGAR